MTSFLFKRGFILPVMVTGVIPLALVGAKRASVSLALFPAVVGGAIFLCGLGMLIWTTGLFARHHGSLAPWNPPPQLGHCWSLSTLSQSDDQWGVCHAGGGGDCVSATVACSVVHGVHRWHEQQHCVARGARPSQAVRRAVCSVLPERAEMDPAYPPL
jgi:hypothetical protein